MNPFDVKLFARRITFEGIETFEFVDFALLNELQFWINTKWFQRHCNGIWILLCCLVHRILIMLVHWIPLCWYIASQLRWITENEHICVIALFRFIETDLQIDGIALFLRRKQCCKWKGFNRFDCIMKCNYFHLQYVFSTVNRLWERCMEL